jgi:hypothetical protein
MGFPHIWRETMWAVVCLQSWHLQLSTCHTQALWELQQLYVTPSVTDYCSVR